MPQHHFKHLASGVIHHQVMVVVLVPSAPNCVKRRQLSVSLGNVICRTSKLSTTFAPKSPGLKPSSGLPGPQVIRVIAECPCRPQTRRPWGILLWLPALSHQTLTHLPSRLAMCRAIAQRSAFMPSLALQTVPHPQRFSHTPRRFEPQPDTHLQTRGRVALILHSRTALCLSHSPRVEINAS